MRLIVIKVTDMEAQSLLNINSSFQEHKGLNHITHLKQLNHHSIFKVTI